MKNDLIKILNSQDEKEILKRNASSIYRQYVINNNKNEFLKNNKDSVTQDTITISRKSPKTQSELLNESFQHLHPINFEKFHCCGKLHSECCLNLFYLYFSAYFITIRDSIYISIYFPFSLTIIL